ncbi:MAG: cation:proton antiporter [Lachnospiraceae bacterium]|nr:cation:proton antiporter [Lachnospiraceae bacterium]
MAAYEIFLSLAIIILFSKVFGLLAKKIHAPEVVGEILAGIIIGPSVLGLVSLSDFISQMAEIGVVLLMFSAGLGTNLKELMKTGVKALLIACCGVFVPLVGGTLLYMAYYGASPLGSTEFYEAVFIGVIMTATSVSITVQSLRELGKLKTTVGTTVLSAAIIDDVIGIIVLTFVIGFKSGDSNVGHVALSTVLFFVFSIIVGFLVYLLFKWMDKRWPHTRRLPIWSLALCFIMAYSAEKFFGIADITGAYVAGIILCSIQDHDYIAQKMDINSYMLFGPIFFASIGLRTDISNFDQSILLFSVLFVIVALITKIIGCGLIAKAMKYSWADSLKIGVGMMTRGEVALIVSQKGLSVGLVSPEYFTAVILLIVASSILTPVVLKLLYAQESSRVHDVE